METHHILTVLLGLASALLWGTSDFFGGLASKKAGVFQVVLVVSSSAALTLATVSLVWGGPLPPTRFLILGGLAGVSASLGLSFLYKGLSVGNMGVVASVAGVVTVVLPVVVGAVWEGLPSPWQASGFALAAISIWLLASGEKEEGKSREQGLKKLALPAGAGFFFGLALVLMDFAGKEAVLWPAASLKCGSVLFLVFLVFTRAPARFPSGKFLASTVVAGLCSAAGTVSYVMASRLGRLDVAAVLTGLYPAATAVLAIIILKERFSAKQKAGVGLALAAIALIAA